MDNFSSPFPSHSHSHSKNMKPLSGCCNNHSDWSGLPLDIILLIMDKLTVVDDYVRFGAVCPAWRTIFLQQISSCRPSCCRLPFLLTPAPTPPPRKPDRQHRALYTLSGRKLYNFRFRFPHKQACRGSSFGWLITLETKTLTDCRIQLRNPFLNRTMCLPSPKVIPDDWDGYFLWKAVLSCDPLLSPNDFVVMAIMSQYRGLAFYKPGYTTWTNIGDWHKQWLDRRPYTEVLFFRKTKQFYALVSNGEVFAIDFVGHDDNPKLRQVAPPLMYFCGFCEYLVEDLSTGDLLQVTKNYQTQETQDTSFQFSVFKLDAANGNWVQVDSLGDNIMFLGNNGSLLRSASECPGCEPNCIYYTDDGDISYPKCINYCGPPEDGIYNLEDGTIQPHYSPSAPPIKLPHKASPSAKVIPQAIWLEPTLKGCNHQSAKRKRR